MQEEKNAIIKQGIAFSSKNLVYKYLKNNEILFKNLSQNSSRGNEELSSGLIHKTAIKYIASSSITDDHKKPLAI
jgi:hypothetical protein